MWINIKLATEERDRMVISQEERAENWETYFSFQDLTLHQEWLSSVFNTFQSSDLNRKLLQKTYIYVRGAQTKPASEKYWWSSCYSEGVEIPDRCSEFDILPADSSAFSCFSYPSLSLSLAPSAEAFIYTFSQSEPTGFGASLSEFSAVSTGQNQSGWMWWTANGFRQFSILMYFWGGSMGAKME